MSQFFRKGGIALNDTEWMEETSEHFLCVHGRFYEYNE